MMSPSSAPQTLTTRGLMAASGASERQVQYWTERGILRGTRGGVGHPRQFPASEAPLATIAKRLTRFPLARGRIVAAIRKGHRERYVVSDRRGRHLRFAETTAEVFALARDARHAVLVVEVQP